MAFKTKVMLTSMRTDLGRTASSSLTWQTGERATVTGSIISTGGILKEGIALDVYNGLVLPQ